MTKTPVRFTDLFRYYRGLPHQMAALEMLGQQIPQSLLHRENEWFKVWSQDGKQEDAPNSWDGIKALAAKSGAKFPELVAAQWALESGWGRHTSGIHNYFGLKGSGTKKQTQEFKNGRMVTITAQFRDFESVADCVNYLVTRWYLDWHHFKGVNHAATRNEAAMWLYTQGYATDPEYPQKLIRLMDQHA